MEKLHEESEREKKMRPAPIYSIAVFFYFVFLVYSVYISPFDVNVSQFAISRKTTLCSLHSCVEGLDVIWLVLARKILHSKYEFSEKFPFNFC